MDETTADDPKGLIREIYRMDGVGPPECRSLLIDWALSLPAGTEAPAALGRLLALYGPGAPDHPMTAVLREGLSPVRAPQRRGGRAGRRGG